MSSRTASIDRTTGETDVSLTLGLSGSGAGTRATGVGFFDHMLDLLARHGKLDLQVNVTGDLQTGAHHTVEDSDAGATRRQPRLRRRASRSRRQP